MGLHVGLWVRTADCFKVDRWVINSDNEEEAVRVSGSWKILVFVVVSTLLIV